MKQLIEKRANSQFVEQKWEDNVNDIQSKQVIVAK